MMRLPKWLLMVLALALLVAFANPVRAEETKGKIKSVSADKKEVVVTDNNGKDLTFQLAEDGKVRVADQDGKLSDLKEGDEVTVTYDKKDDKLIASKIEKK
jgi:Cu/Ag efflux protein CusF